MNLFASLIVSSVLGGTALVPFVDLVSKDIKSPKLTYAIALISSILVGLVIAIIENKVPLTTDPSTWFVSLSTIFLTSQTIFKLYWQSSFIRANILKKINPPASQPDNQPLAESGTPQNG